MTWIWTDWSGLTRDQLHEIARLRQEVFVVEQNCPYADLDGDDPKALHLLGFEEQRLVAYLRVFPPGVQKTEAVIGRVVVASAARGRGLASDAMKWAHRNLDPGPIFLSAQAHLEGFYGSLGYHVSGPGYDEDGIPHLPMIRAAATAP